MSRKEELLNLIGEEPTELVEKLIDEIIFLEKKLEELKEKPFLNVHPQNSLKQKNTPAAKMYKEFLQQYINCIKVVDGIIYKNKRLEEGDNTEESPLRNWAKVMVEKNADTGKENLDTR